MLHITNGESAAGTIRQAVQGGVLAWNDVLHEGPVPGGLSLAELSSIRAGYLLSMGWGEARDIEKEFTDRDAVLEGFRSHDEIVLWFEHDLYDQLQLLQLLDWFGNQNLSGTRLSMICIGEFEGVDPFHGLGQLNAEQMAGLLPLRHEVEISELEEGSAWWRAFTSPAPTAIASQMEASDGVLPFVENAMLRHLEQFPSTANGLSRTELQLLKSVAAGCETPRAIFEANASLDVTVFMGDSIVWEYLERLCNSRIPLLTPRSSQEYQLPHPNKLREFHAQRLRLTDAGLAVMRNELDQIEINGIDRWLGGVHLVSGVEVWRWNGEQVTRG